MTAAPTAPTRSTSSPSIQFIEQFVSQRPANKLTGVLLGQLDSFNRISTAFGEEKASAFCKDYVEMFPNRTENYCCGGGGGTVSIDEIRDFRVGLMGKSKADQIRATGAKYVVAPCANCKKQLAEVCEDHDLDVKICGLHDLILKAIIPPEFMRIDGSDAAAPGQADAGEDS